MNPDQSQGDPVAEAMARRQMGGQPSQQAPQMAPPQAPQPPQAPPMPMGAPTTNGKQDFQPKDGHEFLLTTLAETLKNDYKLESEKLKFGAPQMAPMQ